MALTVPPEVKQVVALVYVPGTGGKPVANGTCFFLGKRDPSVRARRFVYLVTAGHVFRQNGTGPVFDRIWLRLNTKDGKVDTVSLALAGPKPNVPVFFHDDPMVDLAVIPFLPDQAKFDFKILPEEWLADTDDIRQLGIAEGTEVFFTGLLLQSVAATKNVPIVRFGRVALAPGEPVPWGGVPRDLILVESFSVGANSGSPVFFYLGADRDPGSITVGQAEIGLAGVMMGAHEEVKPAGVVKTAAAPMAQSNAGIAAVVPANRLGELLSSPKVRASRGEP